MAHNEEVKADDNQFRNVTVQTIDEDNLIVDFPADDPENPVNWSSVRKWCIVIPVASINLISIFGTTAIIPAAPQALQSLHTTNHLYRTLLVSIWELGEGVGPIFVAPLAERFGRAPVFHAGNALSVIWSIAAALSTNVQMLIAFRFMSGLAGTALTLGPAIIGDLFVSEQRGTAMSIVMGMQVLGSFIAPVCGAFISTGLGWRWIIWIGAIAYGTAGMLCLLAVRETYAVKIIGQRTERLRQETGMDYRSKYQEHIASTSALESATMAFAIMLKSPIVLLISLYTAVVYGTMYLIVTTLTEIMENQYDFSNGVVGLAFIALAVGNVVAMLVYSLTSDVYVKRKKAKLGDQFKLESRLIHLVIAAALIPLAMIFYGWTLYYRVPWAAPLVGVGMVGFCTVLIILSTETYLVDAYPIRSASAVAAGVILRAISGAVYPLSGPPLYESLGYGWGNTVLMFVLLLFLPFLGLLLRYGDRLRRKEDGLLP